jgi:aminoglycoside phosphotransferase (APT) family kinase protein
MHSFQAPSLADLRVAVISALPEFENSGFQLLNEGWDSVGLEADGEWIFKFPRREAAVARLRREHRTLAFIRPRIDMPVPDMTLFETHDYEPLSERQRDAVAEKMATLYAQLHAIPLDEARAMGMAPIDLWMAPGEIVQRARPLLPERLLPILDPTIAAYAALDHSPDDQVFGYFDGHGWNMAFDAEQGVLNGVYDFADSGLGALHQDLSYSNWISRDLTLRIIACYEALTGRAVDRDRVMLYSSALRFLEFADAAPDHTDLDKRLEALYNWFQTEPG